MKYITLIFICCLSFLGLGQRFNGIILDANDQPIQNVTVLNINQKRLVISDKYGAFTIKAVQFDTLRIKVSNQDAFHYIVPNYEENEHQINFINAADTRLLSFDEVTVTADRVKPVVERFNANVLDYHLYKNGRIMTLTSLRNDYKINLEIADEVYADFDLSLNKPNQLYLDHLENLHLIGKDSTYQFILGETEVVYLDGITLNEFDQLLRPVLFTTDELVVTGDYFHHNKKYKVVKTNKKTLEQTDLYVLQDEQAIIEAYTFYNSIIALYNSTVPEEHNIISNGIWNGDLTHLAENIDLIQMIKWFENIIAKELSVYAFENDGLIAVFDFENTKIVTVNTEGELVKEVIIKSDLELTKFKVKKDAITNEYYCYRPNKPTLELYKIDTDNGKLSSSLIMDELNFPKKIQIFNGWMYFIKINDASFNKLYKIKIE